ncbi:hypothetical protein NX059_007611 [Plenodomus lindquistii]|nr:hypothetical protein NX059_007611 [Plenodomus lindquistii]
MFALRYILQSLMAARLVPQLGNMLMAPLLFTGRMVALLSYKLISALRSHYEEPASQDFSSGPVILFSPPEPQRRSPNAFDHGFRRLLTTARQFLLPRRHRDNFTNCSTDNATSPYADGGHAKAQEQVLVETHLPVIMLWPAKEECGVSGMAQWDALNVIDCYPQRGLLAPPRVCHAPGRRLNGR